MTNDHDDHDNDNTPAPPAKRLGRDEVRPLPKRFYKAVSVAPRDDLFEVHLDGRAIRTPAKQPLAVATEPLARAIAAEWEAQANASIPPRCRSPSSSTRLSTP